MINLENVSFKYKNSDYILKNINFSVNDGEVIAIVGKNGSGKSTLGRLIAGITKLKEWGYCPDKFAYPFGRLPKDCVSYQRLLSQHGFKYAYTLWPGNVVSQFPLLVNRICLGDHTPVWWNVLKTLGFLDNRLRNKCELAQKPIFSA